MKPARVVALLAGVLFLAAFYFVLSDSERHASSLTAEEKAATSGKPSSAVLPLVPPPMLVSHPWAMPGERALKPLAPAPLENPGDRSPLADRLNAPEQTIGQDLKIVSELLRNYRTMFGGMPGGESNAQIVNALAGNNPRRIAFIERSNPALNGNGELVDRWGTPFFFHLLSSEAVDIRSAGPDQSLYTADDILKEASPGSAQNALPK